MKRGGTIGRRLLTALTGATLVFWLLAAGLGVVVLRHELNELFDGALEETANRLAPLIADRLADEDIDTDGFDRSVEDFGEAGEYLEYQARTSSGAVLLHSPDRPGTPYAAPLRPGFHDAGGLRVYTVEAEGGLFVQVADPLVHRSEALVEGGLALLLPLVILIPGSVVAIWLILRSALAPIGDLRRAISERDGGNLSAVADRELPVELAAIARSVNGLLLRLRRAIEAEREFTANSAHELRTPIAGALAQTQRLLAEATEAPARERARQVEAALLKLGALAEKLLQLSRAEAGIGRGDAPVDLVPVVSMVLGDFASRAGERLRLVRADGASLMRQVDVDAFAIAFRNLVENALVHGRAGTPVVVTVGDGAVSVVNDCPAIAPDELRRLAERFRRGRTGAAGSGLGLAIAERIVREMGGSLALASPAADRQDGFEARMVLPDR